jgi:hypothetical protein
MLTTATAPSIPGPLFFGQGVKKHKKAVEKVQLVYLAALNWGLRTDFVKSM